MPRNRADQPACAKCHAPKGTARKLRGETAAQSASSTAAAAPEQQQQQQQQQQHRTSAEAATSAEYSHQVQTRWYRAPEILYGAHAYDGRAIDMWGAGCVLGEMVGGAVLFPGDNDIDQVYRVMQVLGSPTAASWPRWREMPDHGKVGFEAMAPFGVGRMVGAVRAAAMPGLLELLEQLLSWDAARRPSASAAARARWFAAALPPPMAPLELRRLVPARGGSGGGGARPSFDEFCEAALAATCAQRQEAGGAEVGCCADADAGAGAAPGAAEESGVASGVAREGRSTAAAVCGSGSGSGRK